MNVERGKEEVNVGRCISFYQRDGGGDDDIGGDDGDDDGGKAFRNHY